MRSRTTISIACFTIRHRLRGSAECLVRSKYCSNALLRTRDCRLTADHLRFRAWGEMQWPHCERLLFQSQRCVIGWLERTTNRPLIRKWRVTGLIIFATRGAVAGSIVSATKKLAG